MTENYITSEDLAFRPRARLLQMLGDQLIGSPRLAIFELVKNAYDADADTVLITLNKVNTADAEIIVEDNGDGMSVDIIKNIWLVPAHDHKEKQKQEKRRTRLNRLPLGEKGLGRFAVHKLGNEIELVTRAKDHDECLVKINWSELIDKPFLEDTRVEVITRSPQVFIGDNTGTQITVRALREQEWTRGDVRKLLRQITSISTPFNNKRNDKFETLLEVKGHPDWTEGVPDIEMLKERAPWHITFELKKGILNLKYHFKGVPGIKIEERIKELVDENLPLAASTRKQKVIASPEDFKGIGDISGEFYIYDREKKILSKFGEQQLVENFLDENGGIRVYRDNIRVYNYGEPGDDWLGLDLRRVNVPGKHISRNIIVGSLDLKIEDSYDLIEKTNREGFVQNEAYSKFQDLMLGVLSIVETERLIDKERLREATEDAKNIEVKKIEKPLDDLRKIAKKHNLTDELEPLIQKTEKNYNEMREVMLNTGFNNMGLAIVFHEVEHGVRSLYATIEHSDDLSLIKQHAHELVKILDSFSDLLRKGENKPASLKNLIRKARDVAKIRFRKHKIQFVCPFLEEDISDIEQTFIFKILIGSLNNIFDNAIYWLQTRWPEETLGQRKIYVNVTKNFYGKTAIIIADNGPGFQDEQEQLVKPFFTRRPNGMGIGLYYINLAMEVNKGRLVILDDQDDIPAEFDGAALALVFD
ncbi:signal transduction histidine kinase [Acinetobacter baylyi]|jgi:signal transduction histidine kinase|uniref:histidine kinase n=1 Tax=Acinetobacter baylyi TaxID=202950 RepID=A0ABU0UZT5_ACIBI|nr:ATP-binding protein [Acinetobacter baylyi]MDQ1209783.1 signal transduction histidine kinase [Acinetobacter baylyi]MDR6106619.1 signal transduction histidine kinase [Acinetobacter baylyi]MDR6186652.1 signal transduction histidine kinase [Acinetobacter baylyi]